MKQNRHDKIIELIEKNNVETQEQLADMLREAGYDVTQATVSRDIRDLRLTKIPTGDGKQKYAIIHRDNGELKSKYIHVLQNGYVSMDHAEHIVVLKTVTGMAMAVAAAIDALQLPEVVGCVAGDDTIMAAIRTSEDAEYVMNKIHEMLKEN